MPRSKEPSTTPTQSLTTSTQSSTASTQSSTTPTQSSTTQTSNKDKIFIGLLQNCATNGDKANSKLARKTLALTDSQNIQLDNLITNLSEACFKHPDNPDLQLDYAQMRRLYG